ncbi:formate-dependent phosphoribosylglycinamide formyltransferase [Haloquadratum walsbyi]|jgi:phosphoribosylglycinamide formyltransferase 2 (EC 2.1.2.-)|uniref:Formate-dependent phosphoribosylglycinamide formyltransferase n=1 Tax=Haloquadratum walsbyi J07HQW2 TaxID=1238425 RepID=U1NGC4_9EURY|nr:formate-dependent phosphoribosylglycinamide formyltransferase [Haloquadratum walsbyi]ERG96180.1 MAG: phosphoribosylglycinamide formyltransferase 2 [Haloquadratum walsbyi J07HQW2]
MSPAHGHRIGTPESPNATTLLLLGSGELGKEVIFAAQQLGLETVAVDRYEHAPAMQAAHRSYTVDMTDATAVRRIVQQEEPAVIIPEIEAIATDELERLEEQGYDVAPTAQATRLTMDRQWIREFTAEEVGVATSEYAFADDHDTYREAVADIGIPVVVKPTMSSSGKGQSTVRESKEINDGWETARAGSRSDTGRVIIEELVEFDSEFTLLTVRHNDGTTFCPPVGHTQQNGDYRTSWQPHPLTSEQLATAQRMAREVTDGLGGHGIFGIEFFVQDGDVIFSELSPRPHDTGLVTLVSQRVSQFDLHLRAILGLPVPEVAVERPGASAAVVVDESLTRPAFTGVDEAVSVSEVDMRLFGKPEAYAGRRMGAAVATAADIDTARKRASEAVDCIGVIDDKA